MASETLPVLTHSSFPQVFTQAMMPRIRRVESVLGLCCWESPESSNGAADGGFPCHETAVVHHLSSDQPFCLSHFREVVVG